MDLQPCACSQPNTDLTHLNAMLSMGMPIGSQKYFYFSGNAPSLQTRLNTLTDQQFSLIVDANITVTGLQRSPMNNFSMFCTFIMGSLIILPLFLLCCNWWKKCTYPCYDVPISVYQGLSRLIKGANVRNVTLTVQDNCFGKEKANILCEAIEKSFINGFSLNNVAVAYDNEDRQFSDYWLRMEPVKLMPNVMSDIRWEKQCM